MSTISIFENTTSHTHLDRHNFNTEVGKSKVMVSFLTYYSEESPVYYELMPFIQMLKFIKDRDILNSLPREWVKQCSDFKDPKFEQAQILPDTMFGEFSAVHLIITSSESKIRMEFVEKLSNICFRRIEGNRTQRIHQKHKQLEDKIICLRDQHERHTSILDVIRDAIKVISEHHNSIEQLLHRLYEKI
ncbi:putative gp013-like protein [Esparto virus]|uniref:Putative gp013-like protein n=1 Tax=Esparto virus TaxID=2072209 RepID=A0A2I7G303_9VIRU|nr:putative gp013-like protein [Esparto virus]AUQ44011.1 putative gp013-like protein [Esparto virus]